MASVSTGKASSSAVQRSLILMQNLSSTSNFRLSNQLGRLARGGGQSEQRDVLGNVLISGAVPHLSEEVLQETDVVFGQEQSSRASIPIAELLRSPSPKLLPCGGTSPVVWRGDIRQLKVDAIVNAANAYVLLGVCGHSLSCVSRTSPSAQVYLYREPLRDARQTRNFVLTPRLPYFPPTAKGWGALCPTTSASTT